MNKDTGKNVKKEDEVDPRVPDVTKSEVFPEDVPQADAQPPRAASVTVPEVIDIKEEPYDPRVPDETHSIFSPNMCHFCDRDPCLAVEMEPMLFGWFHTLRSHKTNREIRYQLYVNSVREIYGFLGRRNRRRLALCMEKKIRSMAPDTHYVGFKKA